MLSKKKHLFTAAAIILATVMLFAASACAPKVQQEPENLIGFSYSYGGYPGGRWEYNIQEKDGKLYLTARGWNGVDLDVNAEIPLSTLAQLESIIDEYDIVNWDGFDKQDSSVSDGYMFSLECVYSNRTVVAKGHMNYPPNYNAAHQALADYLDSLAQPFN